MRADRPVWRIMPLVGDEIDIAADGGRIGATGAAEARRAAEIFGGGIAETQELLIRDQWTVAGGYDRYRPLWKVRLAGSDGLPVTLFKPHDAGAIGNR